MNNIFYKLFFTLNIIILYLFVWSPLFGTIHAIITFIVGIYFAATDDKPYRAIYTIGYILGVELLWRGTGTNIFWEFGKYSTLFIITVLFFRSLHLQKYDLRGLLFIVLLVPSSFLLKSFDREAISFALAGPFVLGISVMYFSQISINRKILTKFMIITLLPILGLSVFIGSSVLTAGFIDYSSAYNLGVSTAGIGPNQVSSILGLGALISFTLYNLNKDEKLFKWVFLSFTIILLIQTVLTFSRGGFWTSIGAIIGFSFYLLTSKKHIFPFILLSIIISLSFYFIIYPQLNKFTKYSLESRFGDIEPTGRIEIINAELIAFAEFPILGVGPGQSRYFHQLTWRESNAHTEYSRLLAEHGVFGLISILMLSSIVFSRIRLKCDNIEKGFIVGFTIFSLLFMFHSATRLVAPAILFGLFSAKLNLYDK